MRRGILVAACAALLLGASSAASAAPIASFTWDKDPLQLLPFQLFNESKNAGIPAPFVDIDLFLDDVQCADFCHSDELTSDPGNVLQFLVLAFDADLVGRARVEFTFLQQRFGLEIDAADFGSETSVTRVAEYAVPEPATLGMLIVAAVGAARGKRTRTRK